MSSRYDQSDSYIRMKVFNISCRQPHICNIFLDLEAKIRQDERHDKVEISKR